MRRFPSSGALCLLTALAGTAGAEVILDGSVGRGSPGEPVMLDATGTYQIEEPLGSASADLRNLFHSFAIFDIEPGTGAFFHANPAIENVVARVTGGTTSRIEGGLAVEGNANLFLLNPSGLLFAGDVTLDVEGSFYASSAGGLVFDDGLALAEFAVAEPAPALPDGAPVSLEFSGGGSGDIVFDDARLRRERFTNPDRVTFAGADVLDETAAGSAGGLLVGGATVQLAAVGSQAVSLPLDLGSASVAELGQAELGSIQLGASGGAFGIIANSSTAGGRVVIRGGELVLGEGQRVASGGDSTDVAFDIEVSSRVAVEGGGLNSLLSSASVRGGGGSIRIAAEELSVLNGAQITLGNLDEGSAGARLGRIEIDVETLGIDGEGSRVVTAALGAAPGNPIQVRASSVEVANGAQLQVFTRGGAPAPIVVDAPQVRVGEGGQILSGTTAVDADGNPTPPFFSGGDIELRNADLVTVESRGLIGSVAGDLQPGGSVRVEDAGSVRLLADGEISANALGAARGGSVELRADSLVIDASILGSQARGTGDAGDLSVVAGSIELLAGGQITGSTEGDGAAGGVEVEALSSLTISGERAEGPSGIFARSGLGPGSPATGDGGALLVRAGDLRIDDGGGIEAQTFGPGTAGAVDIEVAGDFVVADGLISTSSLREGSTNDLVIDVGGSIYLQDGARIESRAPVEAPGTSAGSIRLSAGGTVQVHGASLTTDSARPDSGNVTVEADGLVDVFHGQITTNIDVTDGSGGAGSGDVALRGAAVVVDKSVVTANAAGLDADAGDISIVAPGGYFQSGDSLVQARSEFGVDGAVVVLGPAVDLAPGLAVLGAEFHDPADELRDVCDTRTARVGSFTVRDRVPSPPSPDDPLLRSAPPHRGTSDSCELR